MRKKFSWSKIGWLALIGAALLFAGCNQQSKPDGGGGSTGPSPTTGKVVLVVADSITGASVADYKATFNPPISDFNAVAPGDYTVTVEKDGYFKASAAFKVLAGSTTTVTVNLYPVPPPPASGGQVAVLVTDEAGKPIAGAEVSDGTQSATTDANGRADLTYASDGTYAISVNAEGYFGASQLAQVEMGKTVPLTFALKEVPPPPASGGQVAVLVTDEAGKPIAGAEVSDGTQSATTGKDGLAKLSYDKNGTYAISVNAEGYFGASQLAQVEMGKTVPLTFALKEIPAPPPTTGALAVFVYDKEANLGLPGATIEAGDLAFSGGGPIYKAEDVPPGTYILRVSKEGYAPAEAAAVVKAGELTLVNVGLSVQPEAPKKVAAVELVSVKDQWGAELPYRDEANPVKAVRIYASQTEEPVCVTVRVLDPEGDPVENARVRVSADSTGDPGWGSGSTRLFAGCVSNPSEALDFVRTDENGVAKFTFYSVGGDEATRQKFPVKFVVSATDENDQSAAYYEFKTFFFNVSHLYYEYYASPYDEETTKVYTEQRVGKDLGTFNNQMNFEDNALNTHWFRTLIRRRQPAGDYTTAIDYIYDKDKRIPIHMKMVYRMSGPDADLVEFVSGCNIEDPTNPPPPNVCYDLDGQGVAIRPKASVTAADLPIEVSIEATWYAQAEYGTAEYEWPLKSYTFTKRWTAANLMIEKSGPHIITWTGSDTKPGDVTLSASGASAHKFYTYTIKVTVPESSPEPVKNLVINDNLPAELGFKEASEGGTYDPVLHRVTWDYSQLPELKTLKPGESVEVWVKVYARHKPGYAWDDNNRDGNTDNDDSGYYHSSNPPRPDDVEYPDPYSVINTADARGENTPYVTAEWEIWVVRPFMTLEKSVVGSGPWYVGDPIPFDIVVKNVDRAKKDRGYQHLKKSYPDEYAKEMQLFYVAIRDLFGEGLDFINAAPKVTLDTNKKTATISKLVESLDVGKSASLRIWLRAALAGEWQNCARAYAYNLNQPDLDFVNWTVPPTQYEPVMGTDPRPNPPYTKPETGNPDSMGNYLESCVSVVIKDRPQEPIISVTSEGEYTSPEDGPGTAHDPVDVGDVFWYLFRSHIVGVTQTDFEMTVKFPDHDKVMPTGIEPGKDVILYLSSDNGATYEEVPSTAYTVTYTNYTLTVKYLPAVPANTYIRLSVRAKALAQGKAHVYVWAKTNEAGQTGPAVADTTIR